MPDDLGIKTSRESLQSMDGANPALMMMYGMFVRPDQHCGQFVETQNGIMPTTIYNPPRSDPKVEAVFGEKVYAPKEKTKKLDEVRTELALQRSEVIELRATLSAIMAGELSPKPTKEPTVDVAALQDELKKYKVDEMKRNERTRKARESRGKKNTKDITPAD